MLKQDTVKDNQLKLHDSMSLWGTRLYITFSGVSEVEHKKISL